MKLRPLVAAAGMLLPLLSTTSPAQTFAKGADISWISEMESSGYKFYNDAGQEQDLLQILKDHGMDAIRLRVWVNPTGGWYSGIDDVIQKAQRAQAAGMRIMIDFHYSDSWADPGKQYKPSAWESLSFSDLVSQVGSYTRDALQAIEDAGITPEWVQVGNETNNGMLWEDGKASNSMSNYAALVKAGVAASKAIFPNAKTVIHLANCHDNANFRWIFDGLQNNGASWDVIGASSYPRHATGYTWQEANAACKTSLEDMVSRYGSEVLISEVGVPWDDPEAPQIVTDLLTKVRTTARAIGVLYWEPQAYDSWQGYTLGAWGSDGRPTETLDVFLEDSYSSVFPSLSIRGSFNGWGNQPMARVADNTWQVDLDLASGEKFKVDVYGDWSQNYGDNNSDGTLDQTGSDIEFGLSGKVRVTVNDQTLSYSIASLEESCPSCYSHNFTSLYYRGSTNGWGSESMTLVADHTWEITVNFSGTGDKKFKFDVGGDWFENYGDNAADGALDQGGADIYTNVSGSYTIRVNDENMTYTLLQN